LEPVQVTDQAPLARPPRLPDVPQAPRGERHPDPAGLAASLAALGTGGWIVRTGLRPLGGRG